jgi:amino acid permease
MKWKLIFLLSLFGLAMAFATVFWIPSMIEPAFWLVIFIICAYLIAKNCTNRYFLHGFFVSMVNCVWITGFHLIFFGTYIQNHPEMKQMNLFPFLENHHHWQMALTGPIFGILSGLVLGLFAFIASKLVKKKIS